MRLVPFALVPFALAAAFLAGGPAAAQPAGDALCARYAGVEVGTAQGKPVRPDCAGLRSLVGDVNGLMAELGDAMSTLAKEAAARPFTEILAGDPMIARQCRQAAVPTGTLYRCALSPAMLMSVPVGSDGRAESVRVEFDIEKHVQARLARAGVTINDVIYDIYRDLLSGAKARNGEKLPLTVNGRKAALDFPTGAR